MHLAPMPGMIATALVSDAPAVVKRGFVEVGEWLGRGFTFGGIPVMVGSVLDSLLVLMIFLASSAHDNDAARDVACDIAGESARRSATSSPQDPKAAH